MIQDHDERIDEILAEFLQKRESGEPVDHDTLIASHPEFADEIREFLGDLEQLNGIAESKEFEQPGTQIGPYKLREQIGKGGFGVVYVAEQMRPVRRKVALKLIKPGMDTEEVIGRFEAERQALALMDHPNIAHVLDAGATESGRPYFVMELVKGISITEYCDQCNLPTRDRLELFRQVCQAVQHAHQKGIIHRDVKPSNVLVAMQDGKPVPKVIDFGVAKAINQRLTEQTVMTAFAQMIGTPLYMSPEQAEMSPLDVDTRSDVYSLGVLLYELLTGTTPFSKDRLKSVSYDELRRIIREEEPPRPSHRISTLGQDMSTIAEHRRSEPRKLRQLFCGELDWIVLKALEKDRTRRYETANGLAEDIRRYLENETVQACPPSTAYRLKKFVRRNTSALITGVVIALLLITGTAVSTWQAIRATDAEQLADDRYQSEKEARQSEKEARRLSDAARNQVEARRSGINGKLLAVLTRLQDLQQKAKSSHKDNQQVSAEIRHLTGQAESLAASDLADRALTERVQRIRNRLLEAEKNRRVVALLAKARSVAKPAKTLLIVSRDNRPGTFASYTRLPLSYDYGRAVNQAYSDALAVFGIAPGQTKVAQAASVLRRRPRDVQFKIVVGLDEWLENLRKSQRRAEILKRNLPHYHDWIVALVQAVDDDPWRVKLRDAIKRKDQSALKKLADSKDLERQAPYTLVQFRNELKLGLDVLKRAQRRYPDNFELNEKIWFELHRSTRPPTEETLRYASIAAALRPADPVVARNLGATLDEMGRLDEAATAYLRATSLPKGFSLGAECLIRLGAAVEKQQKWDAAARLYARIFDVNPTNRDNTLRYGIVLKKAGRTRKAEAVLRVAAANFEASLAATLQTFRAHKDRLAALDRVAQAYSELSGCLREAGRQDVIKEVERLADEAATSRNAITMEKPRHDLAVACTRRAVKLKPDYFYAHYSLGKTLSFQRPAEAIAADRKAMTFKMSPAWTARCCESLAKRLTSQGKSDEAEAQCRDTLRNLAKQSTVNAEAVNSARADIMASLAVLLTYRFGQGKKRPQEGLRLLRQALELRPDDSRLWCLLAGCLANAGNWKEAADAARKGFEWNYAHPIVWTLVRAEWKTDNSTEARRLYRMAVRYSRGFSRNRIELGPALGIETRAQMAVELVFSLFRRRRGVTPLSRADFAAPQALKDAIEVLKQAEREGGSGEHAAQCRAACQRLAVRVQNRNLPSSESSNEALAVILSARKLIPANPAETRRSRISFLHFQAGVYLARQGKIDEAIASWRNAVKLNPRNSSAWYNIGIAYSRQKNNDQAIASFHKAIDIRRPHGDAHYQLALALQRQKRLNEAIDTCMKAVRYKRNFDRAYFRLGELHDQQKKTVAAIYFYRRAIRINARNYLAHDRLARALARHGEFRKAIESHRRALRIRPDSAWTHNQLAWLLAACPDPAVRNPRDALIHAKKAVRLKPRNDTFRNTLGVAHYRAGNWKDAMEVLKSPIAPGKSGNSWDWFFLAMSHSRLGNKAEARRWCGRAVRWMKDNRPNHRELRRFRREAELLMDIRPRTPARARKPRRGNREKAYYALATFLQHNVDIAGAVDVLRQLIQLSPNHAQAHDDLAWLLATIRHRGLHNPREALRHARRAVQIDPTPANHWTTRAVAAYRAGEWKEALQSRQERIKRLEHGITDRDRIWLAMIHWRLGEKSKARKHYKAVAADLEGVKNKTARWWRLFHEAQRLLGLPLTPRPSARRE